MSFETFDNTVKNSLSFLDNEYVSSALTIFLIVYASMVAPKLPNSIVKLFDYTLVKLLMFFLIAYVFRKNPTVAIIAAVGLLISLMTLNRYKVNKEIMAIVKKKTKDMDEINDNVILMQNDIDNGDSMHVKNKMNEIDQTNEINELIEVNNCNTNNVQNMDIEEDIIMEEKSRGVQVDSNERDVKVSKARIESNMGEFGYELNNGLNLYSPIGPNGKIWQRDINKMKRCV
ncbi:MAG: hypothetical protein Edafosvirus8_32 [Edafosvirus sp.]|uniref:Uncharacterized protein n=1 Tax=Edafosvirus sp. TaxID=2487765 RepID=A0A3G4ZTQ3_9VIRU|nr:MAG: hypothetical protein Edafosvirus8_32 [Edafosvirus sp.]